MPSNPLKTHRPALATTAVAFLVANLDWAIDSLPAWIPPDVIESGHTFLVLLIGAGVGLAVEYLGENAPWSADMHRLAVAYAATLDPEHADEFLPRLGVQNRSELRELVGVDVYDPDDEPEYDPDNEPGVM